VLAFEKILKNNGVNSWHRNKRTYAEDNQRSYQEKQAAF
jgi:hypothetical protein